MKYIKSKIFGDIRHRPNNGIIYAIPKWLDDKLVQYFNSVIKNQTYWLVAENTYSEVLGVILSQLERDE